MRVEADTVEAPTHDPRVERVGDRSFLQLEAPGFADLTLREKLLAYHLARAAVQIDPIFYDQMSAYGLNLKRLLGALVESPARLPIETRGPIVDYAKLVFANGGNRRKETGAKFLPAFAFEDLARSAEHARIRGARLRAKVSLDALLQRMRRAIFDPSFPSSNNFYEGVSVSDLSRFAERHPFNSRVARRGGQIVEEIYRAGTSDGRIPPGRYAAELRAANRELEKSAAFCEPDQAEAIRALVRFYETGDAKDWLAFGAVWAGGRPAVDFASGFLETDHDPRGAKGSARMFVAVLDRKLDPLLQRIAENAASFEGKSPSVGSAVSTLVETGDSRLLPAGACFPGNRGAKCFVRTSNAAAWNGAGGSAVASAFSPEPGDRELFEKYGNIAGHLHAALHAILGHSAGLAPAPGAPLREFLPVLEEARADLVACRHAYDPKLSELGVDDVPEVAREIYRQLARSALTTLNNYPEGDAATDARDRARLLIVNTLVRENAFERVRKDGRAYTVVTSFERARESAGRLLEQISRFEAEGDEDAMRALVRERGTRFDPALRDDVVRRCGELGIAPRATGIYPELVPVADKSGKIADVVLSSPRDYLKQQVEFARLNGTLGF